MPREGTGKDLKKETKAKAHGIRGPEQTVMIGSFIRNLKENLILSAVVQYHFSRGNLAISLP